MKISVDESGHSRYCLVCIPTFNKTHSQFHAPGRKMHLITEKKCKHVKHMLGWYDYT